MQVAENYAQRDVTSGKIPHERTLWVCVLCGSEGSTPDLSLTAVTFGVKGKNWGLGVGEC